jgi:hypothetical protein
MFIGRVLYWLLTGALIGFGAIAILSIGFPFLLLGLILVVFGPLTTYHVYAFGFGVIALIGLAWPLLHQLVIRPHGMSG